MECQSGRIAAVLAFLGAAALGGRALADPCEAPLPRKGASFAGVVRYVGDGDGLCVGTGADPRTWVEVRLEDFYAPELNEPGGRAAKAALERLAMGRRAVCTAGERSYDRVVARCAIGGVSVGQQLRRAGVREGGRGR